MAQQAPWSTSWQESEVPAVGSRVGDAVGPSVGTDVGVVDGVGVGAAVVVDVGVGSPLALGGGVLYVGAAVGSAQTAAASSVAVIATLNIRLS